MRFYSHQFLQTKPKYRNISFKKHVTLYNLQANRKKIIYGFTIKKSHVNHICEALAIAERNFNPFQPL